MKFKLPNRLILGEFININVNIDNIIIKFMIFKNFKILKIT